MNIYIFIYEPHTMLCPRYDKIYQFMSYLTDTRSYLFCAFVKYTDSCFIPIEITRFFIEYMDDQLLSLKFNHFLCCDMYDWPIIKLYSTSYRYFNARCSKSVINSLKLPVLSKADDIMQQEKISHTPSSHLQVTHHCLRKWYILKLSFCKGVPGFATDYPCSVLCRR